MEFVSKKTFIFLALRAAIIDLDLEEHKDVLEELMVPVIKNSVEKEMQE